MDNSLPSQRIKEIRRMMTRFSNLVGVDLKEIKIFNPTLVIGFPVGFSILMSMQINGSYQAWPNLLDFIQTMFYVPGYLLNTARLINRLFLKDEFQTKELENKSVKFYEKEELNLINRKILLKKVKQCKILMKLFMIAYYAALNTMMLGVLINVLFDGSYKLIGPIYLPFTNPKELTGFIINALLQLFYTQLFFVIFIPLDFQYIFFGYQIIPMFDILIVKLKNFGEALNEHEKRQRKADKKYKDRKFAKIVSQVIETDDVEKIENIFPDLIQEYMKIVDFTNALYKLMNLPVFSAITAGGIALCLCALTIFSYSAIIGTAGIVFYFWQIAAPCFIGSAILYHYEKFLDEICGFPWYLLSKKNKKTFLQFIQICQNYGNFEITMIGNVDIELLTTVMNAGYSYYAFLWNFI